jgi:hypothetical protein
MKPANTPQHQLPMNPEGISQPDHIQNPYHKRVTEAVAVDALGSRAIYWRSLTHAGNERSGRTTRYFLLCLRQRALLSYYRVHL